MPNPVEETGELTQLADTLARGQAAPDVLHLSCHGGFHDAEPALFLETDTGDADPVGVRRIVAQPVLARARLLFLSACHTADEEAPIAPLTQQLLEAGVPAVLGWSGAVGDAEASLFAATLYRTLAQHQDLAHALAAARFDLLNPSGERRAARDWHLARLYLGRRGGGVLSAGSAGRGRLDPEAGHKEFLDAKGQQIAVAGRRQFVGRRRQVQTILRAVRSGQRSVLIHGMGRQGKSSLAARVANRMPDHVLAVVYKRYEAADILAACERYSSDPAVADLCVRYKDQVREDPQRLETALKELLEGPCRQLVTNRDGTVAHRPLLLMIDDLERILGHPGGGGLHRVGDRAHRCALGAVVRAFQQADTDSRLLLTSRYRFALPHADGTDLAEGLTRVHLHPMEAVESRKQARRRLAGGEETDRTEALAGRAIEVAQGNPGLQDLLFKVLLAAPETAEATIRTIEDWMGGGAAAGQVLDEELRTTLEELALGTLHGLLTQGERDLLRASTLFGLPVPRAVLGRLAVGGEGTARRLLAFGLWDTWADPVDTRTPCAAIDPLAHAVAGGLSEKERHKLAGLVAGPLLAHWCDQALPDPAAYELLRLGVLGGEADCILAGGEQALARLYNDNRCPEAAHWGTGALAVLEDKHSAPPPMLLRWTGDACVRVGDTPAARMFYRRALDACATSPEQCPPFDHAAILRSNAQLTVNDGAPDEALKQFQEAHDLFDEREHIRERAVTLGDIARIQVSKGQVDEALQLHEERIAVFEALGDQRSRAVTLFDMAHIALSRQDHERAFRYLAESYDIAARLGDASGIANVGAYLGQLLLAAGNKEEGLSVLARSLEAFELLGQTDMARQVAAMIDQV